MRTIFFFFFLTFLPLSLPAMGDDMHEMHEHHAVGILNEHTIEASGKVKAIGEDGMTIRIFHDPIAELKWPAMNMIFRLQDPHMAHSLKAGDKISFEFIQKEGENVIVKITQ